MRKSVSSFVKNDMPRLGLLFPLLAALGTLWWYLETSPSLSVKGDVPLENSFGFHSVPEVRHTGQGMQLEFGSNDAYFQLPFSRVAKYQKLIVEFAGQNNLAFVTIYPGLKGVRNLESIKVIREAGNTINVLEFPLPNGDYKSLRIDLDSSAGGGSVTVARVFVRDNVTRLLDRDGIAYLLLFYLSLTAVFLTPRRLRVPCLKLGATGVGGLYLIVLAGHLLLHDDLPLKQRLVQAGEFALELPVRFLSDLGDATRALVSPASYRADLPVLKIQLSPKALRQLRQKRNEALTRGNVLITESGDEVGGFLILADQRDAIKIRLRLKGDWTDHIRGDKWSFRIKIPGNETFLGMRRFSVQANKTRGGHGEELILNMLRDEGLLAPRYFFVHLIVNDRDIGVMAVEQHFTREMLESQGRKDSVILAFDESSMWRETRLFNEQAFYRKRGLEPVRLIQKPEQAPLKVFSEARVWRNPDLRHRMEQGMGLMQGLLQGSLDPGGVCNMEYLGRFTAILNLWNVVHGFVTNNLRFYYNPYNRLLEPVGFDNNVTFELDQQDPAYVGRISLCQPETSVEYIDAYIKMLKRMRVALDSGELVEKIRQWESGYIDVLAREEAVRPYPVENFKQRLAFLESNPPQLTSTRFSKLEKPVSLPDNPVVIAPAHVYWVEDEEGAWLEIRNLVDNTLVLESVRYERRDAVDSLVSSSEQIPVATTQPFRLPVPYSPSRHRGRIMVDIRLDANNVDSIRARRYVPVIHRIAYSGTSMEELLSKFPFLELEGTRVFRVRPGNWTVEEDLVLPKGFDLRIPAGTTLGFFEGVRLAVFGALRIEGQPGSPVRLVSATGSWAGLLVIGQPDARPTLMQHARISGITAGPDDGWGLTGAITVYNTSVDLQSVAISDVNIEDALNLVQSEFKIVGLTIDSVPSDALDIDFGSGTLSDSVFRSIGGDAVDISGTTLHAQNLVIEQVGDKAISIGEKSQFSGQAIKINDAGTGVVSKDGSIAEVSDIKLENIVHEDYMAYVKKKEYPSASLSVERLESDDSDFRAAAVGKSTVIINGRPVIPRQIDINLLYDAGYMSK